MSFMRILCVRISRTFFLLAEFCVYVLFFQGYERQRARMKTRERVRVWWRWRVVARSRTEKRARKRKKRFCLLFLLPPSFTLRFWYSLISLWGFFFTVLYFIYFFLSLSLSLCFWAESLFSIYLFHAPRKKNYV